MRICQQKQCSHFRIWVFRQAAREAMQGTIKLARTAGVDVIFVWPTINLYIASNEQSCVCLAPARIEFLCAGNPLPFNRAGLCRGVNSARRFAKHGSRAACLAQASLPPARQYSLCLVVASLVVFVHFFICPRDLARLRIARRRLTSSWSTSRRRASLLFNKSSSPMKGTLSPPLLRNTRFL